MIVNGNSSNWQYYLSVVLSLDASVQWDNIFAVVIVAEDGDLRYSILGKQETGEVKWMETRKERELKLWA